MDGCVVIQTCDSYAKFWPGLAWSMDRYWDFEIPWPIFLCNEEAPVKFANSKYQQIATGKKNHADRVLHILDALSEYDYVFYMTEEFWPTDPMSKKRFLGLFDMVRSNKWDCLRVATYLPKNYDLERSPYFFDGEMILKYSRNSKWQFSNQASFWDRNFMRECVAGAEKADIVDSTCLPTEMACDEYLRQHKPDAKIYHYPYHWYPISGVVWRGKLSPIGEHIETVMNIEHFMRKKFPHEVLPNINYVLEESESLNPIHINDDGSSQPCVIKITAP